MGIVKTRVSSKKIFALAYKPDILLLRPTWGLGNTHMRLIIITSLARRSITMTRYNVHASRVFFNEISTEIQELQLITEYFEVYIERARERMGQTGDYRLLTILEHLESFLWELKNSCNRLESACKRGRLAC
jgi:hypothetical protein